MVRAKRFYVPGYVWHITHRCHNQEFLLRFDQDRRCWMYWLSQAKNRFSISILNYSITSNHVHLLAVNNSKENSIAKSIHLAAGRTAQEFNKRKNRKGAFWEDRYHATAVETGLHLLRCMVYIDTNMVRAGAVIHPREWAYCGYHELMGKKARFNLIDDSKLSELIGLHAEQLKEKYESLIEEYLECKEWKRERRWTESLAIGSNIFVKRIKNDLCLRKRCQIIHKEKGIYVLDSVKNLSLKNGHKNRI